MKRWSMGRVILIALIVLVGSILLGGCGSAETGNNKGEKVYKIGIMQLVQHPALDAANKGFIKGLASKGFVEGKNITIDQQNAQGDQSNLNTIGQRFLSEKEDLIAVIATPAAQTMGNLTKTIPIVGMAITDYEAAKLVQSNDKPGGNITGTSDLIPTEKQVDLMMQILPNLKKVGVIYNSSEINSEVQVKAFKKYAESKGLTVVEGTVSSVNDVPQVAQNLVRSGIEAVYIPTDNVMASAIPSLLKVTNEAKIPVFPSEEALVKAGCIAVYSLNYEQLGFQAGVMAAAILNGSKPSEMPIERQNNMSLVINKEAASLIGLTIPSDVLSKASQ